VGLIKCKVEGETENERYLVGEVQRILMMAPGKRTLFLKGRIAKRLGSSTDSAMVGTQWRRGSIELICERGKAKRREKKGEEMTPTMENKYGIRFETDKGLELTASVFLPLFISSFFSIKYLPLSFYYYNYFTCTILFFIRSHIS